MKMVLIIEGIISFAINASAADILHSGTCGTNCSWTWDDTGILNITGEGEMTTHPWTNIEGYKTDVKSVKIQGTIKNAQGNVVSTGITSVASDAFFWMQGVEHLEIGDSVTTIGDNAFRSMWGVKGSLNIPSSVQNIGRWAFLDMMEVTGSLVIPDTVTEIKDGAFWGLKGITTLIIPDSVTSIGENAFFKMDGLTELTVPDTVTSIGENAFAYTTGTIYCPKGLTQCADKGSENLIYYTKNSDGSTTFRDINGKLIGYKGKRIYTIEEASRVAGKKNTVKIRYK